jgi:hypothetical protein
MDPATAIGLAVTVINTIIKLEPQIVSGFTNLKGFASTLVQEFTGAPITDDNLALLEAQVDALADQIAALQPPPGTPE